MNIQLHDPQEALFVDEAVEYDAVLIVSFGGPEGRDEVIPFLENVLRGRNVPRERMIEVAEHYMHFGGVSPINEQTRALIAALKTELDARGLDLPIYWGNRNWHPLLEDTIRQMRDDGIKRALAFFTSAYSSYSGCRQYREDIAKARAAVGEDAPVIDRIRMYYNHPGFIEPNIEHLRAALAQIPPESEAKARVIFTAHSLPLSMAQSCAYVAQLQEAAQLVAQGAGITDYDIVYQSRSGPSHQLWLEPDILDHLDELHKASVQDVVILPLGFISDHMEVLYDLDTEALQLAEHLGMNLVRAATVGTHPRFIEMIRELIIERMEVQPNRPYLGQLGPVHDICPADCCLSGRPTNTHYQRPSSGGKA